MSEQTPYSPDELALTPQDAEAAHASLMAEHPLRPGVRFGVFDTQDNLWIGDSTGPKLFVDQEINGKMLPGSLAARLSAELCDIRMRWAPGRCKAMPFNEKTVVHKDDVTPHMSTEEALAGKESGKYL